MYFSIKYKHYKSLIAVFGILQHFLTILEKKNKKGKPVISVGKTDLVHVHLNQMEYLNINN